MFSKLFTGASLALSLLCKQSEASTAVATFSGSNGIEGSVSVSNGAVTVELNITGLAENGYSGVTDERDCFVDGLKYHIHMDWAYNNSNDRLGCARGYTGNHWDPWLGCGGATDNDYCTNDGGCVNGSSVLSNSAGYACSTSNFDTNPYSCEVGDWSGKYGAFVIDLNTSYGMDTLSSPYEADGSDMEGYSVVFHCNGGARAFCAPFEVTDTSSDTSRPEQSSNNDVAAVFADLGYVYLQPNGTLTADIDISSLSLPSDCGDTLYYRIFDSWTDSDCSSGTDSCDSSLVGYFYDPTVTCAPGSGSVYCNGTYLCDDSSYDYDCDWDDDRFSCAPGDLSGKFGGFDVSGSDTSFSVSTYDPLMTDLSLLDGLSIVIQCSDTWEMVACAEIVEYSSGFSLDTEVTSCEDAACFSSSIQLGSIFVMILTIVKMIF